MTIDLDKLEALARAATAEIPKELDGDTAAWIDAFIKRVDAFRSYRNALSPAVVLELAQRLRKEGREVDRLAENARRFDSDWMAIRAELDETKAKLRAAEARAIHHCETCIDQGCDRRAVEAMR